MNFSFRQNSMDETIFRQVFIENEYELASLEGRVVLDIGCHIGSFAAKAAQCGAGSVISFEPNKQNFLAAQANLSEISQCQVRNVAVGRSDIQAPMCIDESDNPHNHGGSCTVTDHGVEVETVSLDEMIKEFSPTMIKVDAEGAEYPALYTSSRLDQIETVFGEFHNALGTQSMGLFLLDDKTPKFLDDFKGKLNMRSLARFLKEQGFRVLVDNIDANIGHFWASRTFDGLNVEAS